MKKTQNNTKSTVSAFSAVNKTVRELLIGWRDNGYSEKDKQELLKRYWEWAMREDSLQFVKFYLEVGITSDSWDRLRKSDERFDLMHKHVKEIIGARREALAWYGKIDSRLAAMTLRVYNPDFRQVYEEDKEAKMQISKEGSSDFQVIVDQVKKTDVVPEKGSK